MPKWLSAAFALFLSLQVFGARGRSVDKILTNYLYSFHAAVQLNAQHPISEFSTPLISTLPFTYRLPNLWCKTLTGPAFSHQNVIRLKTEMNVQRAKFDLVGDASH